MWGNWLTVAEWEEAMDKFFKEEDARAESDKEEVSKD